MSTVICIDAGHGGEMNGEVHVYKEKAQLEKTYNLEISQLIELEFRKYENVEIIQTHREDVNLNVKKRIQYAVKNNADYIISLHSNFLADEDKKVTGSMVIVPGTHYQPPKSKVKNIYNVTNSMGHSIIKKLKETGFPIADVDNGVIRRVYKHKKGEKNNAVYYDDGSAADLNQTMRQGIMAGIPTIVIKHSYMSTEEEFDKYLSTWKNLQDLAKADVQGIAEALNLKEKPERTKPNVLSYV